MRLRLPKVGALLRGGDISYAMFQTIVYRTDLITDAQTLATVDGVLAQRASRWPALSRGKLAGYVDKVVARADADAVRQRREQQAGREVVIFGGGQGLSQLAGQLFSTDAQVLESERRLNRHQREAGQAAREAARAAAASVASAADPNAEPPPF